MSCYYYGILSEHYAPPSENVYKCEIEVKMVCKTLAKNNYLT